MSIFFYDCFSSSRANVRMNKKQQRCMQSTIKKKKNTDPITVTAFETLFQKGV